MAEWPKPRAKLKHNGELGCRAKVEIRTHVLDWLGPDKAHVFDAFCGPSGEMHSAVWSRAADYVGVDIDWRRQDSRARFVAPAALVLRSIDLERYNVFDLDPFGSPWSEAIILAARRRWAPGERGALVLTDGSGNKLKFGRVNALLELVGTAHHKSLREPMLRAALAAWCKRARVTPVQVWESSGYSNPLGSMEMRYSAVTFVGIKPSTEVSAGPSLH